MNILPYCISLYLPRVLFCFSDPLEMKYDFMMTSFLKLQHAHPWNRGSLLYSFNTVITIEKMNKFPNSIASTFSNALSCP